MRMRFLPASRLSNTEPKGPREDLLVLLVRLIRHAGYSRDAIVSEQLKRCFPNAPPSSMRTENELRQLFVKSAFDQKTIEYLTYNATLELCMARERAIG